MSERPFPANQASTTLGARLRAARKHANLSQEQAARAIGATGRSIGRWEQDEAAPAFEDVAKLAQLFDVSLDWLAGRTSIVALLRPGSVVVDEHVQELVHQLVRRNGSLRDLPARLVRHPGVEYAFRIPERCLVLSMEAARAVDLQMRRMLDVLRGGRR